MRPQWAGLVTRLCADVRHAAGSPDLDGGRVTDGQDEAAIGLTGRPPRAIPRRVSRRARCAYSVLTSIHLRSPTLTA